MFESVLSDVWRDLPIGMKANQQEAHTVFNVNLHVYQALVTL